MSKLNLNYIRTAFIDSLRKEQYYKLLKVLILNCILCHFFASMLLALTKIDPEHNWMAAKNIY